jgi:hypothetical protein
MNKTAIARIATGGMARSGSTGNRKPLGYRYNPCNWPRYRECHLGPQILQANDQTPRSNDRWRLSISAGAECHDSAVLPYEKARKGRNFGILAPLQGSPKVLDKVPGPRGTRIPRGSRVRTGGAFPRQPSQGYKAANTIG